MSLVAAMPELGFKLGALISWKQDALDYINSLQMFFNSDDHFLQ